MKGKIVLFVLVAVLAVVVLAGCSSPTPAPVAVNARVFKLSLSQSVNSSWYKAASKFAELVKQRSGGKYALSVFANASLTGGDQNKELEGVQKGTIDFSFNSTSQYSNLDPRYSVSMLPWLFGTNADVDKVLNGALGQEMLGFSEAKDVVGLCLAENGFRQITNSKREIKTPDDLKGLKIRTPSTKIFKSTLETLGATTSQLNLTDVYSALRDGAVDGQENAPDVAVANKFYDVQKFMTVWNYSYSFLILGVNKTTWNGLDKATQDMLKQSAKEACAFQVQESRSAFDSDIQFLKSKGMTVTTLNADQIKAFRAKVGSVYTDLEATTGKEFIAKFTSAIQY